MITVNEIHPNGAVIQYVVQHVEIEPNTTQGIMWTFNCGTVAISEVDRPQIWKQLKESGIVQ